MPIRVANITIEGRWGGPQKRILEIANQLKLNNEIELTVIFPNGRDSSFFRQRLEKDNIHFIETRLSRPQRSWYKIIQFLFFFIFEVFNLAKILKQNRIDIIHCNGIWQIQGIIAGILARKKIVWHMNDTYDVGFFRFFLFLIGGGVSAFCVSANRVRDIYLNKYFLRKKPVYLIRPPVDTIKLSGISSVNTSDNPGKITVGTLCNINPVKDLDLFVDIAELLSRSEGAYFKFILAGPIFESQLKYGTGVLERIRAIKQKGVDIEYIGEVSDAMEFYKKIDIFLCTSLYESGPMTVFEAMSMRKAVVTSDVGDLKNIIADGVDGFVIQDRNPESFAEKILMLGRNKKLLKDFGQKAREKAVKDLDVRVCALKHVEMYKALVF